MKNNPRRRSPTLCFAVAAICLATIPANSRGGAAPDAKPTFTEQVAPIIFQNCVACHRPGEAAPFALLTYEQVRKRGRQIAEVTETKFMPPWHAEAGHVAFLNPRVLRDEQIATLRRWYEDGMPEGDAARLPKLPVFPDGWQFGKPDLIVKMEQPFKLHAEGPDIYRNFVFPLNLPEDKWVRAIEFRPSTRSIVHHALFYLDPTGKARELDAAEAEPGFGEKGRVGREFTPVGGWAVGSNVRVLPEDLAYRYPQGADLVVQTHFHPTGKAEEELSTVGIFFADKPPVRSFVGIQLPPAFGEISGIDIPAGVSNYLVKDSFTLPVDVEAFSISPHAHYIAKTMTLKAVLPDGREKIFLRIPDWDFAWQEQYSFKERVRLPKGTRLESELIYDNSATNPRNPISPPVRVKWGTASTDEMGSITLHVVPVREADVEVLRDALKNHSTDMVIDRAQQRPKYGAMVKKVIERFDKNGNGQIDADERDELRIFVRASGWVPGNLNNSF
jgi:mono/diheme cytochrome c family protein